MDVFVCLGCRKFQPLENAVRVMQVYESPILPPGVNLTAYLIDEKTQWHMLKIPILLCPFCAPLERSGRDA